MKEIPILLPPKAAVTAVGVKVSLLAVADFAMLSVISVRSWDM